MEISTVVNIIISLITLIGVSYSIYIQKKQIVLLEDRVKHIKETLGGKIDLLEGRVTQLNDQLQALSIYKDLYDPERIKFALDHLKNDHATKIKVFEDKNEELRRFAVRFTVFVSSAELNTTMLPTLFPNHIKTFLKIVNRYSLIKAKRGDIMGEEIIPLRKISPVS